MDSRERNRREWERPENWHGPRLLAFYAAENDTRILVPKRKPSLGWTINLAHPAGRAVLLFLVALAVIGAVLAIAYGGGA